jgi:hypothetical protein
MLAQTYILLTGLELAVTKTTGISRCTVKLKKSVVIILVKRQNIQWDNYRSSARRNLRQKKPPVKVEGQLNVLTTGLTLIAICFKANINRMKEKKHLSTANTSCEILHPNSIGLLSGHITKMQASLLSWMQNRNSPTWLITSKCYSKSFE